MSARSRLCMPVLLWAAVVAGAAGPLLAASALPPWVPPARPKPKLSGGSPAADAFLKALAAPDSTAEQRQEAWAALANDGQRPTRAVAKAVDHARKRAWKRLDDLIRSSAVRRTGAGLRKAIVPHQAGARSAIHGGAFSKEKLDQAMAPLDQALDEAIAPLRDSEPCKAVRASLHELEGYAVGSGLRHGWSDELLDTLCTLRFVVRYAGTPSWLETVDGNHRIGPWIDPGEHACIARLNRHRILLGIAPVHIDLRLGVAAKKHSEEMVAKGYFSHESPTPALRGFGQRASREHTGAGGECIAGGGGGGVGVFRMWYYSQGHHTIMVSGAAAIGVGRCGSKWTLMMGGSRMSGATAIKMAHYVRRRYLAADDADKLFDLARWCADNRLLTQAQDELERLLALDADHEPARKALERMRGQPAPGKDPER